MDTDGGGPVEASRKGEGLAETSVPSGTSYQDTLSGHSQSKFVLETELARLYFKGHRFPSIIAGFPAMRKVTCRVLGSGGTLTLILSSQIRCRKA
jgi:hypothetical protein